MKQIKRLYRDTHNSILGGVCSGLADYFEVDPVLIRLLWVIGTLLSMGLVLLRTSSRGLSYQKYQKIRDLGNLGRFSLTSWRSLQLRLQPS